MQYYLKALKNYSQFKGRATRSEFWFFILFNFIFAMAALLIDNLIHTTFTINSINGPVSLPYGYVYLLYALVVLIPGLALYVRRLHDVNKSGWFIFIAIIPIVGAIWLLVLLVTDSDPGDNKYGPNPKGLAQVVEQY